MGSRKHRRATYFSGRPTTDKANHTRTRTNHSCRWGNVIECLIFNTPHEIRSKPKHLLVLDLLLILCLQFGGIMDSVREKKEQKDRNRYGRHHEITKKSWLNSCWVQNSKFFIGYKTFITFYNFNYLLLDTKKNDQNVTNMHWMTGDSLVRSYQGMSAVN